MEHHFDFESSVMQNQSLKWDLGVGLCGEEACGWGSCLGAHKTPCNPQVNGKTDNDDRKTNIDISALSTWWR